ncbi:hypothetical protein JZ751_012308 [Albula glossodonta]|uniref:Uncharacterized protein n=1 Tax=Albula glossodonta TaxID=121402 RepID=A0A8T2PS68_9TELE|nr:hypothetical protein JZ751_012308 [Albula glossodonta]
MTPSSDVLQFRFAGHGDTVLEKMNKLREDRRFCDVTLILGGFRFPGHRVVLAASSAFLRDQFLLHEAREVQVSVLPNAEVGRRLLLCCYTGVLEFPLRELVTYLTAASALQMSHVVEKCAQAVSQYLDPTLAQLKLEKSADPPPLKESESETECLGEGDPQVPEGLECDLDSEDSVQIVHTDSGFTGTLRHKQPRLKTSPRSPTGSPTHSRAGVADSSQDQEFGGGDVYMLASQHLQLGEGDSPRPGDSEGMSRDTLMEHDSAIQRSYFCRKCDRVFQHLENYVGHLKEHKLYLCLLCGKSFSQKSNLTRHIRVHTGIKPFQCPLCHKTFSQKATLQDHLNLHTGNKPHKCNYCAMHFAHKPGLRRHLKDIHGKSSLENMFEENATLKDAFEILIKRSMKVGCSLRLEKRLVPALPLYIFILAHHTKVVPYRQDRGKSDLMAQPKIYMYFREFAWSRNTAAAVCTPLPAARVEYMDSAE